LHGSPPLANKGCWRDRFRSAQSATMTPELMRCDEPIKRRAQTAILLAIFLLLPSFCSASGHPAASYRNAARAVKAEPHQHESMGCHHQQAPASMKAPARCPDCCETSQQQQAAITADKFVQAATMPIAAVVVASDPSAILQIENVSTVAISPPLGHLTLRI
jgi:hypothetical protein